MRKKIFAQEKRDKQIRPIPRENKSKENLGELLEEKPYSEEEQGLLVELIGQTEKIIPIGVCSAIENTFENIIDKLKIMPNNFEKNEMIKELLESLDIIKKSSQFPEINQTINKIKKILTSNFTQEYEEPYDVPASPIGGPLSNNTNNPQEPIDTQEN
jgi:hypothetical protein